MEKNIIINRLLLPINIKNIEKTIKTIEELQQKENLIKIAEYLSIHYLKDKVYQMKNIDLMQFELNELIDFISMQIKSLSFILKRKTTNELEEKHYEQLVLYVINTKDTVSNILNGLLLPCEYSEFIYFLNTHSGLFKNRYKTKVNLMYNYCKRCR